MPARRPTSTRKRSPRSCCGRTRAGSLATLDRNTGHPFASLVNIATDSDGSPVILVSRLSTHTANLEADGRASVLLAATGKGDPLAHPRLTLLGTFVHVGRDDAYEPRLRRRFLARHPKSELYAGFADFSFWKLETVSAHLNGGFARAADLKAADVLTEVSGAAELLEAEAGAIAHMNADHAEAVRLYATKLLGAPEAAWRLTGLDPEGLDLASGDTTLRLVFPTASPLPRNCARWWWIWRRRRGACEALSLRNPRETRPLFAALQQRNTTGYSRLGLRTRRPWQRRGVSI